MAIFNSFLYVYQRVVPHFDTFCGMNIHSPRGCVSEPLPQLGHRVAHRILRADTKLLPFTYDSLITKNKKNSNNNNNNNNNSALIHNLIM